MTIRLGLISDLHAQPAPLSEALSLFERHDVDLILCSGDIAGYGDALDETVSLLAQSQCLSILGNHEIWYLEKNEAPDETSFQYINSLPRMREFELAGKKVLMVHANPPDKSTGGIRLLNKQCEPDDEQVQYWTKQLAEFEYDVLIVGHTHQVYAERLGSTLVINPGSTAYNHSCAILNLPELTVKFYALSGKQIRNCWNWSEQFRT
jgi:putative phosphoesterase